ncbi:MAG: hypothetical protein AAF420_14645, partial [Pseudomonadota bacterium]
ANSLYSSSCCTISQQRVSNVDLGPNGTTGDQLVNAGGTAIATSASSSLNASSVGATSAYLGTSILSAPNSSPNRNLLGSAYTRHQDMLTITSSTLNIGDPVQIQFALAVSWAASASHSSSQGGTKNFSQAQAWINGAVSTTNGPGSNYQISSSEHNVFFSTTGNTTSRILGVFDPMSPILNFTYDSKVGDILAFNFDARADVTGAFVGVSSGPGTGTLDNTLGSAFSSLGVAFGAVATDASVVSSASFSGSSNSALADIVITSALNGGNPFPSLDQATVANALLGQPPSPIPLPPSVLMLLPALAFLMRYRK